MAQTCYLSLCMFLLLCRYNGTTYFDTSVTLLLVAYLCMDCNQDLREMLVPVDDTSPIGIDLCGSELGIRDGNVRGVVKLITDHNFKHTPFIANVDASKSAHIYYILRFKNASNILGNGTWRLYCCFYHYSLWSCAFPIRFVLHFLLHMSMQFQISMSVTGRFILLILARECGTWVNIAFDMSVQQ